MTIRFKPGERFGRLTVIEPSGSVRNRRQWLCLCDCGNKTTICATRLRSGNTKSCGCLARDIAKRVNTKHGGAGTPEYVAWVNMKNRCDDPSDRSYRNYGGRGITYAHRWQNFPAFLADIGPRPSAKHTLDRKDNDGDYTPSNCHWATREQQANNRRTNHFISHKGKRLTITQWARRAGMTSTGFLHRIRTGWSFEDALKTPKNSPNPSAGTK